MTDVDCLLYGGYGLGNLGDDALMVSFVSLFRRLLPEWTLGITAARVPAYIGALAPGAVVVPRKAPGRVQCRLLVYGGGTQWYSFPGVGWRRRLLWRLKARVGRPARRLGVHRSAPSPAVPATLEMVADRRAAVGIGVGPFLGGSVEHARRDLAACDFLAVRDDTSLAYCRDWGLSQAERGADICWCGDLWGAAVPLPPAAVDARPSVGVIVRDWPHTREGAAYERPLVRAVRQWRNQGLQVTYLVFSRLRDEGWLRRLRQAREDYVLWDPSEGVGAAAPRTEGGARPVGDFVAAWRRFSVLVSARYHGLVMAATLGIPTVAIEVEPKLALAAAILRSAGPTATGGDAAAGCELWPQPFDGARLVEVVNRIMAERAGRSAAVLAAAAQERSRADQMIRNLAAFLGTRGTRPVQQVRDHVV